MTMAEVAGISSVTKNGYRNLSCPFCGLFMKVKIVPGNTKSETHICKRCKSKLELVLEEETNGDGSIKVNLCITSAIKTD